MKISYAMIARVCSDNDDNCAVVGFEGAMRSRGANPRATIPKARQAALDALCEKVRLKKSKGKFRYSDEPVVIKEELLWKDFASVWTDGFLDGITDARTRTQVSGGIEEVIDYEAAGSAAGQRVMRVIYLLVRRQTPMPGDVMEFREKPVVMREESLVAIMQSVWLDGYLAGLGCETRRIEVERGQDG